MVMLGNLGRFPNIPRGAAAGRARLHPSRKETRRGNADARGTTRYERRELLERSSATLRLELHGEVDVVVAGGGRRIHDLLERLELDALVGLDDRDAVELL